MQQSKQLHRLVGLTGSIGSGKSAAAAIFSDLGARIIDADILARKVVEPGSPGLGAIVQRFGEELLLPDGSLNRSKLAQLVFNSEQDRKNLEKLVHPLIRQEFNKQLAEIRLDTSVKLIIAMIPLLFETNNRYPELDKIIVVAASPETCVKRIMHRDNCSQEFAEKKLAAQLPMSQKIEQADIVIDNNHGLAELKQEVQKVWKELTE